jgi:hypothetical protein
LNVLASSRESGERPINYMHIWQGGVRAQFAETGKFCPLERWYTLPTRLVSPFHHEAHFAQMVGCILR